MEQKRLKNEKIFEYLFYRKLIGYFIKKGKKKKVEKILNKAFFYICKKFKYRPSFLILRIFLYLETFIESKTFKKRRKVIIIPFPLKIKRRVHLALKWYSFSILECKNRISMFNRITKISTDILLKKNSKAFYLQKDNYELARLNRSNMHFRW